MDTCTDTDTDMDVIDDTYGCFTGRATGVVKLRTGHSTGCDRSANCFCILYKKWASDGLRERAPVSSYRRINVKKLTVVALCPFSVQQRAIST